MIIKHIYSQSAFVINNNNNNKNQKKKVIYVIFSLIFQDLNHKDVMILDSYDKVYVWRGQQANQNEIQAGWDTAKV